MVNARDDGERQQRLEEVTIDLSHITSKRDVHQAFASSLHFPNFYGHDWDAFWDVLCGFNCFPQRLILSGRDHVHAVAPRALEMLDRAFTDCQRQHADVAPNVTWT